MRLDLADLMGCGYIVDNCISEYVNKQARQNFEIYITDAVAALINMFSKNKMPRYWDIVHPKAQDNRSGEEIAADVIAKHGLKVVG